MTALIKKLPEAKNRQSLAVPLSIKIYLKCTQYNLDFQLVRHLHFFDLQCVLIKKDIAAIEEYLDKEQKLREQKSGANVKEVSGLDAKKFLGR